MSTKILVWLGVILGGVIGQFLPVFFGVSVFSLWTIFTSGIGSIIGIIAGLKIGNRLNG